MDRGGVVRRWGGERRGPVVLASILAMAIASCARESGQPLELRASALSGPQTASFQDGPSGYAGTADARVVQNSATTNFGTSMSLSASGDSPTGSGRDVSALVRWDLSSLPAGSTVQAASLTFRITDASSNSYMLFALKRAWSESTATWQQAATGSTWQTAGAKGANDRDPTVLGAIAAPATGSFTVTLNAAGLAKVQQWVSTPALNFGLIVASASNRDTLGFSSSETTTVANRPRLTITYLPPQTPDAGAADAAAAPDASGQAGAGGFAPDAAADTSGQAGAAGSAPDAAADVTLAASGGTDGAPVDGSGTGGSGGGTLDAGATAGGGGGGGGGATAGGGGGGGAAGATAPPPVLYAVGDIADCTKTGDTATGLLMDGLTGPIALLGDIAYPDGSDSDFANCFDPPWGRHRARFRPAPGNHEYQTPGATGYYAYFGAAAGDPAKGYYSYDVGAWHVVALNSNCSDVDCTAGGEQEQWLRQDLAANPRACTLAYWHHPRFSSGHNGNATTMAPIWQALDDFGADLVLAGHDHGYQRLGPMNASGAMAATGIVELVVGTGGADLNNTFSGTKPANVVVRNGTTLGVVKLTLRDTGFDWQFMPVAGQTFTDVGSASCR